MSAEIQQLQPQEIPAGWTLARVGDLVTLVNGYAFKSTEWQTSGLPIIRIQNLNNPDAPFNYVSEAPSEKVRIRDGDLLFAWSGTPGTSFGAHIWQRGDAVLNQHIFKIVFDSSLLDPEFLRLTINHNLDNYIRQAQGGSGLSHITKGDFEDSLLLLAPLNEQHRIVHAVTDVFQQSAKATAALARAQANLKLSRSATLEAAIRGELTQEWRAQHQSKDSLPEHLKRILTERRHAWEQEKLALLTIAGKPARATPGSKYKQPAKSDTTGLSPLPSSWVWATIEEVGLIRIGRQRAPAHHTGKYMRPYLRVANVFEDRIDISDVLEMNFSPAEFEQYRLRTGDILLNEGQSLELVGRAAIFRDEIPNCCFQNTLIRFRAVTGVLPEYALLVFRAYLHNRRFQQIARWTTNIAHLGAGRFAKLEFPLPPLAEQKRIVSEANDRLSDIHTAEQTIQSGLTQASRLRKDILERAFLGKLVSHDPSDEPAQSLVDHIRQQRPEKPMKPKAQAKDTTKRRTQKMPLEKRQSLLEILKEHPKGLSPEDLLREAGYKLEHVDDFYNALRACTAEIEEVRPKRVNTWPVSSHIVLRLKRK